MKRVFFLWVLFLLLLNAYAQSEERPKYPQFPGGEEGITQFLVQEVQYPQHAREMRLSGTVIVGFTIDTAGYMKDLEVISSAAPILDEEALRVCKAMPRWEPGEEELKYQLPFQFELVPPDRRPHKVERIRKTPSKSKGNKRK